MAKVTLKETADYLKTRSHDDLANDVLTLFTRFDAVRAYYQELLSVEPETQQPQPQIEPVAPKRKTATPAKPRVIQPPVVTSNAAPVSDVALRQSKAELRSEFSTSTNWPGEARLSVARKVVSDFKKTADSTTQIADLMLYYVECGVRFTDAFGDIDEPFYASMESMYARALDYIVKYGLRHEFEERCQKIVHKARNMGWGFPDALSDSYRTIFGEDA